jgi:hypothetical protein
MYALDSVCSYKILTSLSGFSAANKTELINISRNTLDTYIKDNRQLVNIDYQFNSLSSSKLSTIKLVYNKFDLIKNKIEEKNSKILSDERWNRLSSIIKIQI